MADDEQRARRRGALALSVLLLLFVARVVAQLWQYLWPNDVLPPFSEWQSGLLPYPALVTGQIAIILVSLWVIGRLMHGVLRPRPRVGLVLLAFGTVYFVFMAFRLVAGLTILKGAAFFGATLPAVFHLVLASMLIITARQLRRAPAA